MGQSKLLPTTAHLSSLIHLNQTLISFPPYTNVNTVIRFGCGKSQCSCVTTSEQFNYSENMNQPYTNTAIHCKTELKAAGCKFVAFWEVTFTVDMQRTQTVKRKTNVYNKCFLLVQNTAPSSFNYFFGLAPGIWPISGVNVFMRFIVLRFGSLGVFSA